MDKDEDIQGPVVKYVYKFVFPDGKTKSFDVVLDGKTLNLAIDKAIVYPSWARLGNHKCPNCPLDEKIYKYCPAAVSMVSLVDFCKDMQSCQHTRVAVESSQRTYIKNASLQEGLSALIGIYMAAGGCPILGILKPMVRFHLPFADMDETAYRVFSMYLFAQYFLVKKGVKPDWQMENLTKIYKDISKVNNSFCERLRSVIAADAGVNAVIILDAFSSFIQFSIKRNAMRDIEQWFDVSRWST